MASIAPWIGSELGPKAGIINLSNGCLEEAAVILKTLRATPNAASCVIPT